MNQFSTIVVMILFAGPGCFKKIDSPEENFTRKMPANLSIAALRNLHFQGNFEQVQDDWVIAGEVVADDRSGNFYKSLVIQDSTGGVTVLLEGYNLYAEYPIGSKIAIRLMGLWLGDYGRLLQIGGSVDRSNPLFPGLDGLPQPMFSQHIFKQGTTPFIIPKTVKIDELNDSLQSCLIKMEQVEFAVADTAKPLADAVNGQSRNLVIKSCAGGNVIVRTSGFADFANSRTPRGNGSVTAIYSVFKSEKQLIIRDTSDIKMEGLRCTGTGVKILLAEDFESSSPNNILSAPGWKNVDELGNVLFQAKRTAQNSYAEIAAFATGAPAVVSWLISPRIDLSNSTNEVLSFQSKDAFDNGAQLQVYISSNYDGGNSPWNGKWTSLKANFSKGSAINIAGSWTDSGNISLKGYTGIVYIGFRYAGADPSTAIDKRTTTFQIDNISIRGN